MEHPVERPILAVDLGGTQIRAALVTPDQAVSGRRALATDDEEGVEAVVGRIAQTVIEVRDAAAAAGLPEPVALGISSPGPLDPRRGIVVSPPNLRGWHDVPIVELLAPVVGLPIVLERDTNVAVMGEWRYGAARGVEDAVYITVSTGIGGGVISDGRPVLGPRGMAGEVGHLVVEMEGPTCGCGGVGHVEAIASGTALAREAEAVLAAGRSPALARIVAAGDPPDGRAVARAAAEGDPACTALLDRAWVAIGALCASLVNLLTPEVIVIGGGIAEHHPRLFEVARREVARRAMRGFDARVRIEPASLGKDVSLIGLLPIVTDRIGDPAAGARSQASQPATEQQGATLS